MMGETLFIAMLVLFWVAEFAFGAVVIRWFLKQGFAGEGRSQGDYALETPALTKQSLLIWALFFGGLVALIIVGA